MSEFQSFSVVVFSVAKAALIVALPPASALCSAKINSTSFGSAVPAATTGSPVDVITVVQAAVTDSSIAGTSGDIIGHAIYGFAAFAPS